MSDQTMPSQETERGFVFAATGAAYIALARRAAQSVAETHPGIPIDLFCDDPETDTTPFAQVHTLTDSFFRPKFAALRLSRFARTICLDADVLVLADISDVFDVLAHFDIAAAQVQNRNAGFATQTFREPVPNAFPQINTGVLGVRASERTHDFLDACETALRDSGARMDQPIIRELLYQSDLRLATLGEEYNFKDLNAIAVMGSRRAAPRVIHASNFHRVMGDGQIDILSLSELAGPAFERHVRALIAADRQLSPGSTKTVRAPWRLAVSSRLRLLVKDVAAFVRSRGKWPPRIL